MLSTEQDSDPHQSEVSNLGSATLIALVLASERDGDEAATKRGILMLGDPQVLKSLGVPHGD
jgi:hypothetical protein